MARIPAPLADPDSLEKLLRQTRRSPRLDYIKWWDDGTSKLPLLNGFARKGNVVTMQDATPVRLKKLPIEVFGQRLIAMEFAIDFLAKSIPPSPARDEVDQRLFMSLVARLCPWAEKAVGKPVGLSPGTSQYRPLRRNEVSRDSDGTWLLGGVGKRVVEGRERITSQGMHAGTAYFGADNRAATSRPGSRAAVQIKVYRKIQDAGKTLTTAKQCIRLEVTCNAKALESIWGATMTVGDISRFPFVVLVNRFLALAVPRANAIKPFKANGAGKPLKALLRAHRSATTNADVNEALANGNYRAQDHANIDFAVMAGPTDVLREAAHAQRRKLTPLREKLAK